jgi:preprotein translocase subunit SecG
LASCVDRFSDSCYNSADLTKSEFEDEMSAFAPYFQVIVIILSTALVVAIILQSKGAGLGGLFGGGDSGGMYKTRRGAEKYLFNLTIGLAVAFFIFTLLTFLAAG